MGLIRTSVQTTCTVAAATANTPWYTMCCDLVTGVANAIINSNTGWTEYSNDVNPTTMKQQTIVLKHSCGSLYLKLYIQNGFDYTHRLNVYLSNNPTGSPYITYMNNCNAASSASDTYRKINLCISYTDANNHSIKIDPYTNKTYSPWFLVCEVDAYGGATETMIFYNYAFYSVASTTQTVNGYANSVYGKPYNASSINIPGTVCMHKTQLCSTSSGPPSLYGKTVKYLYDCVSDGSIQGESLYTINGGNYMALSSNLLWKYA